MNKKVAVISSILLLAFSFFIGYFNESENLALITFSIFMLGIVFWYTNVLPAPITGIIIIVLFSLFGVLSFEEAVSGLGHPIIWLVIAVLVMGVAIEKNSLDKRIAYSVLSLAGRSQKKIIFLFICISFLFTFIIPNAMGRLAMLLPIGNGMLDQFKIKNDNFGKAVMLSITLVPYLTAVTVMTGASGSIYAVGLFKSILGYEWSYLHWLLLMLPITLVVLLALWVLLLLLFPPENDNPSNTKGFFQQRLKELGAVSPKEKKLMGLYAILILLWVTTEFHSISISMAAVMIMCFLFTPGFRLLEWEEARTKVNWGIPLLFASGLALALAFENSGLITLLSEGSLYYLQDLNSFVLATSLMILITLIRLGFTNFNAVVASLMPVILTFAVGTDVNPVWLGMLSLIASSTSFILPTQSIGSMTTYALGYYTSKDFIQIGTLLTIVIIVTSLLAAFVYWPFVGLGVYD
ncbi:DASS family sodium-coupled anion symporter [Shouchella shacheensis]|uniref:DASS family sodium-coupled anion symporter n=1 Tax=Shouchella shacheensis TaxID=1649580 RepID=UPI00073FB881|nr:DASS family sodium-coupled anion symporter [Shouchella shacheensis]